MKKSISITLACLFLLAIISCESKNEGTGQLHFDIKVGETFKSISADEQVVKALVSIEDQSGDPVYIDLSIDIYRFDKTYISEPLALGVGDYTLVKFWLLDADNNVVYAAPKTGSKQSSFTTYSLPLDFSIQKDVVTKIEPEVVKTENSTPTDFGYNTFAFSVVNTIDFLVAVFTFSEETENFELSGADIEITSDNEVLLSTNLNAITNKLTVASGKSNYIVNITKEGFPKFTETYSESELSAFFDNPLTVVLKDYTMVFKPDPENGKDAVCVFLDGDTNYGDHKSIIASAWTRDGIQNYAHSYFDFDYSLLPANAEIIQALLSLKGWEDPSNINGHSWEGGLNEAFIKRVTNNWDEHTITWNTQPSSTEENKVILQASTEKYQDYLYIDITKLVKDSRNNPNSSYGFMIQMVIEEYYRRMVFGSSDNPDPELRPELVIKYTLN